MPISLNTTVANDMLDVVTTAIDAGGAAGKIRIYSGDMPIDADGSLTGANLLLAELTLSFPAVAVAANAKSITFDSITQDASADNGGVATFFRVSNSTGSAVFQGSISATGDGGDMQLNTTVITQGGPVQVTSFVVNLP